MASNKSDYNKPFSNIFELLPNVFRSDVSKALMENGFNRFLTKTEMQDVVGVIGSSKSDPELNITEIDSHRQANQLQPLIYNKIATVDHISSFKDILRESVRLGVDSQRFAEWGDALRFNFAPPIDLDKIVNYRDYYWMNETNPQYITIKNRARKVRTIVMQAYSDNPTLRDLADNYLGTDDVSEKESLSLEMDALYPGFTKLIEELNYIQVSNPLNQSNPDGWDAIDWDPIVNGEWGDPFEGLSITNATHSSFSVQGDFAALFNIQPLFDFAVIDSANNTGVYQVAIAVYDQNTNVTEIFVDGGGVDDAVVDGKIAVSLYDAGSFDPIEESNYDMDMGDNVVEIPNPNGFMLQTDPWSQQNYWVHISDIPEGVNLSLVRQATQPIVEYNEFIELNEWSYTKHVWSYNGGSGFVETDAQPSQQEIFADRDSTFPVTGLQPIEKMFTIDVSAFPNALNYFTEGSEFSIELIGAGFKYYTVIASVYDEANETYTITVDQQLPGDATVNQTRVHALRYSSQGDDWTGFFNHWAYERALPPVPVNRQLLNDTLIPGSDDYLSESEIMPATGTSTRLYVMERLQYRPNADEIRVYVNGTRQYGNYVECYWDGSNLTYASDLPEGSIANAIQFLNGVGSGTIRIDVGPAAQEDSRLASVNIRTSTQESYTVENKSLVQYRIVEQQKTEETQYPLFDVFELDGTSAYRADPLWKFVESGEYDVNSAVNKRIVVNGTVYGFEQTLLEEDDGVMYGYREYESVDANAPTLRTIWRKGNNNERYTPRYIDGQGEPVPLTDMSGDWEVPEQMTHNLEHQNRKQLTTVDLYQHFKSIIESQENPPGYISDSKNRWRVLLEPNYGLGGSINEFNDGFDTFISSTFVRDVTLVTLLKFVRDRYENQINIMQDAFQTNIDEIVTDTTDEVLFDFQSYLNETLINMFENNNKRDIVFGDSTTYNHATGNGVRGWVATLPFVGLLEATKPKLLVDESLGLVELTHHDGHISTPSFDNGRLGVMLTNILKSDNAVRGILSDRLDASQAPLGQVYFATDTGELFKHVLARRGSNIPRGLPEGAYWYDTTTGVLKVKRSSGFEVTDANDAWVKIDLTVTYANVILEIENRLHSAIPDNALKYDITDAFNESDFTSYEQSQFVSFTKEYNVVNPYIGDYNSSNPFTWNYSTLSVTDFNISQTPSSWVSGTPSRWYDLYADVYGTRYPHLEPWVLQGYIEKPSWWDTEYAGTARRWSVEMWNNILSGVVPQGYQYVNGVVSLGTTTHGRLNGVSDYDRVPVNVTDNVSSDGLYGSDDLLPPWFNSSNPSDADIVSFGCFVNTPPTVTAASAGYTFGQNGPMEDTWRRSSAYNYDLAEINYLLQPIRFIHYTLGNNLQEVDGLTVDMDLQKVFSHRDMVFHGEIVNGQPIQVHGLNQWYVNFLRFNDFDLETADFKSMWVDWRPRLAYQTASFIDARSLALSTDSQYFDSSDFELLTKRTPGLIDMFIDSLKMVVNKVGAHKLVGGLRVPDGNGSDWRFRITTPNPSTRNIVLYGVDVNTPVGSFKAMKGQTTTQNWTHNRIDKTRVLTFSPGDIVDTLGSEYQGIQGLINLIDGYVAFLEDQGFVFSASEHSMFDTTSGRTLNWQLETEKMIDQIYRGMASDQLPVEFFGLWNYAFADVSANKFTATGSKSLSLREGDMVQMSTTGNLPAPFKRESVYYVVNIDGESFQLSAIKNGTPIQIQTMGQGIHSVGMNRFDVPSPATLYEINPFRNQVIVNHPIGVMADVHAGSFVDIRNSQGLYDQYGRPLKQHFVNVFRSDKQTRVVVNADIPNDVIVSDPIDPEGRNLLHVGGMHAFIDGYEHAILLNSRTIEGNLLFDEFLGSSIRKIIASFRRQSTNSFRPNVGGYVVDDDTLRLNFEGSVEQIQNLYDAHLADENSEPVQAARNLIGFERKEYFDNMGITPKSQLLFHRGMIQHKGSTNAVKAFINSRRFIDANVDEFWAYKVAEYGDSRKEVYPELVLTSRDTNTDKLMFEFTVDEQLPPPNFVGVSLDDDSRWYNRPEQLREVFKKEPNLFFEAEVTERVVVSGVEAATSVIALPTIVDGVKIVAQQPEETGQYVVDVNGGPLTFTLSTPVIPGTDCVSINIERDGVVYTNQPCEISSNGDTVTVSIIDEDGTLVSLRDGDIVTYSVGNAILVRDMHYRMLNAKHVSFDIADDVFDLSVIPTIDLYCLNPAKTKLNPVKLIDYQADVNVQNIPVWDPARGHHYHVAENIVNYESETDPAFYTDSLIGFKVDRNKAWKTPKVGEVWWDTSTRQYVPYYDDVIYNSVDRRAGEWGRLADYGSVNLYEWVQSPVPPSEYVEYLEQQNEFVAGTPRTKLFARERNTTTGSFDDMPWTTLEDEKLAIWGHEISGSTYDVSTTFNDGDVLELYVSGIKRESQTVLGGAIDVSFMTEHHELVLIKRHYQPSEDELEFNPDVEDDGSFDVHYRVDADYVKVDVVDDNGVDVISTYYFWASKTSTSHNNLTLERAEQQLTNIPAPFVIFQNLLASEMYGSDNGAVMLPDRYTQAIFRGVVNMVTSNDRYKLRFTKNFTLRDDYEDATPGLRSRHEEWKMIREKQKFNIPRQLWDKLTEAVAGKTLSSNPVPVPSLNRVLYDEEFGTSYRFGLRDGQSFVPKLRGLDVIIKSIEDPRFDLYPIDRDEFLSTYKFDTPDSIIEAMNAIYTTFLPEHVNRIWFAALHEGLANNIKYTDIFKTSWIQLDGVRLLDTSGVLE